MQHGHMDQVGYDTYCKLLDEVIKEEKGIEIKEEKDVIIDLNISSYIPDSYIENEKQKIEVYQNIALCRNKEDEKAILDAVEDMYGKPPKELINLLNIAEIKQMCKDIEVTKIVQKQNNILFYFEPQNFALEIGSLLQKYEDRIKFSNGIMPYVTYKLKNNENTINEVIEFLKG